MYLHIENIILAAIALGCAIFAWRQLSALKVKLNALHYGLFAILAGLILVSFFLASWRLPVVIVAIAAGCIWLGVTKRSFGIDTTHLQIALALGMLSGLGIRTLLGALVSIVPSVIIAIVLVSGILTRIDIPGVTSSDKK